MAYDRDRYERDRDDRDRDRLDRDRSRHEGRGFTERAGDEIRSWFGDDDARRRRDRDEREAERWSRAGEERWQGDPYRSERAYSAEAPVERYRDYSDRYGRTYAAPRDRERDVGRGPAFQPYARGVSMPIGTGGLGWRSAEAWWIAGPHAGRGPRGYQRSDERIREEINDRLTAHGYIDATDVEVRIQNGEVTLTGFVDSRDAKRAAEDVAEDVHGVREVHNQLRIRSHADPTGVGRTSVLGLTEREMQTVGRRSGGRGA